MKIQIDNQQAAASTELRKTSGLPSAAKFQTSESAWTGASAEDRLEMSSFADRFASASAAHSTQRAEHVKELTALYQSGRYEIDTAKLSKAIVNSAVNTGWPAESAGPENE